MSYPVEGPLKKVMQKGLSIAKWRNLGSPAAKHKACLFVVCYAEWAGVSEVLHVLSARERSDRTALQVSRYVANMFKQPVAFRGVENLGLPTRT